MMCNISRDNELAAFTLYNRLFEDNQMPNNAAWLM